MKSFMTLPMFLYPKRNPPVSLKFESLKNGKNWAPLLTSKSIGLGCATGVSSVFYFTAYGADDFFPAPDKEMNTLRLPESYACMA